MKRRIVPILAGAALLTIGLYFWLSPDKAITNRTTRIGYVSSGLTGLAAEVMRERRIVERQGLGVEFVGFANPQALNQAFFLGEVDVNIAAGANVVASQAGVPPKFVYFHPTLLNTVNLIGRKDSAFHQLADLKNRKVAWYGPLSGGGTGFMALCERAGLGDRRKFFQMVQTTPGSEGFLLEKAEVDAAIAFEPIAGKLIASGKFERIVGPFWKEWQEQTGSPMEMAGMATSKKWDSAHQGDTAKLIAAWRDTVDYINEHFDEVMKAKSKLTGLDSPVELEYARKWIQGVYVREWGQLDTSIKDQIKVLHQNKLLDTDSLEFMRKSPL